MKFSRSCSDRYGTLPYFNNRLETQLYYFHVETNDAKNLTSRAIVDDLLKLKALEKDSSPMCRNFTLTPTLGLDFKFVLGHFLDR